MLYSIYKISNTVNQKVYIGYTSNFENRKKQHIRSVGKKDSKLYRAMRLYGVGSFSFEIIYQSKEKNHTKNTMEAKFIEEYDSYKNGYNGSLGGDGFDSETNSHYAKMNWENEEYRKTMKINRKEEQNRPEMKKFHSEHSTEMWKDGDYREKVLLGIEKYWTEEKRKEHGEKIKNTLESPEQKLRLSENQKKQWDKPGYRENQKIKQSQKWDNPESKSYALKGKYLVTDPEGLVYKVTGLKKFCREHSLDSKAMYSLSNKKRTYYKGWSVVRVEKFD